MRSGVTYAQLTESMRFFEGMPEDSCCTSFRVRFQRSIECTRLKVDFVVAH